MDTTTPDFVHAGSLEELKAKGRLVVHGRQRPVLLVYEDGHVFALDNRCPHMGFPLERGSAEDGILTCHWHHARFELASGCTFDLWADDVPRYEVVVRDGRVYLDAGAPQADPRGHYERRLREGLEQDIGLIQFKSVIGLLELGVAPSAIVRENALFGVTNRDGWASGLTSLGALV